jgi:hypothetical protein
MYVHLFLILFSELIPLRSRLIQPRVSKNKSKNTAKICNKEWELSESQKKKKLNPAKSNNHLKWVLTNPTKRPKVHSFLIRCGWKFHKPHAPHREWMAHGKRPMRSHNKIPSTCRRSEMNQRKKITRVPNMQNLKQKRQKVNP